jgi:hypothetical protein
MLSPSDFLFSFFPGKSLLIFLIFGEKENLGATCFYRCWSGMTFEHTRWSWYKFFFFFHARLVLVLGTLKIIPVWSWYWVPDYFSTSIKAGIYLVLRLV